MASGKFTVRVEGYREVTRALNRVDRDTRGAVLAGLKKAAGPVAEDVRHRLSGYRGISLGTIAPRAVGTGVFITQKRGKKTGQHPYFGSLQMRQGLIPAAEEGQEKFTEGVDEALGLLIAREGLS